MVVRWSKHISEASHFKIAGSNSNVDTVVFIFCCCSVCPLISTFFIYCYECWSMPFSVFLIVVGIVCIIQCSYSEEQSDEKHVQDNSVVISTAVWVFAFSFAFSCAAFIILMGINWNPTAILVTSNSLLMSLISAVYNDNCVYIL